MAKKRRVTKKRKAPKKRKLIRYMLKKKIGVFKRELLKLGKLRRKKQTKKGLAADRRRKAEGPGKRRSRSGKIYYESRINRAD